MLGFGFKKSRRFPNLDSRLVEKHVQVEQITALESLQNTPQLLRCNLEWRVDMNLCRLGQIRPPKQKGTVLSVYYILIIGDIEFERPLTI